MALTYQFARIFGHPVSSPEVWSQREFTAKSAPDRTNTERKLLSVVDNLGSVQSGECTRCTLSEKIPLTGPFRARTDLQSPHQQPTLLFTPRPPSMSRTSIL